MSIEFDSYPFSEKPEKEIGSGFESVVKELGPKNVIKEANPFYNVKKGEPLEEKPKNEIEKYYSKRTAKQLQKTEKILGGEDVFGDRLIKTTFVVVADRENTPRYIRVQPHIYGGNLSKEIRATDTGVEKDSFNNKLKEYFRQNNYYRKEYLELLWGVKSAFIKFGVFFDFHPQNVIAEEKKKDNGECEKTGRLVLIDIQNMIRNHNVAYGPSFTHSEGKLSILAANQKHYQRIVSYEESLQLTSEEKAYLDEKYQINNNEYDEKFSYLTNLYKYLLEKRV